MILILSVYYFDEMLVMIINNLFNIDVFLVHLINYAVNSVAAKLKPLCNISVK